MVRGTIDNPENEKTYYCIIWFGAIINTFYIKEYVLGMIFIGRETIWTRVK
ncbi:MAG: DUF2147 domain-containing protein [Bacteroidales bacterium]|nr:DUF2147 domain-containing protein [Bacteroidales bacterium]